jgi:hypothetical protein
MTYDEMRVNTHMTALIAPEQKWVPITENTPTGRTIQLINDADGVALLGVITSRTDKRFTHWCHVPDDDAWVPVTKLTPRGVKMLVINWGFKVPNHGILGWEARPYWTHYHPLPTF